MWHLASLDAPSVAVAWSLGFAWAGGIQLTWQAPLVLALTTWSIYVGDRLLDARFGMRLPARSKLQERHYFHWRHRRVYAPLATVAACAAAIIALFCLPAALRVRGVALAAASAVYLAGIHLRWSMGNSVGEPGVWRRFPPPVSKELQVSLLFTAGCMLPSWPQLHHSAIAFTVWSFWIPGMYFAGLVWLNCSRIALWESGAAAIAEWRLRAGEAPDRYSSAFDQPALGAAAFGPAVLVALAGLVLAIVAPASQPRSAALLVAGAVGAMLLALLDRLRSRITAVALRAAADAVMLTPLFLLLR